jgi:hypothetical protein
MQRQRPAAQSAQQAFFFGKIPPANSTKKVGNGQQD